MFFQLYVEQLKSSQAFFNNTLVVFSEDDSGFVPVNGMFSLAAQISHTAHTIDWFVEGAFNESGFDLNFEQQIASTNMVKSFNQAKAMFNMSVDNAVRIFSEKTEAEVCSPIAQGPILGGLPRIVIVGAIVDHTAHHRGALSVYARLLGRIPVMPYGEAV